MRGNMLDGCRECALLGEALEELAAIRSGLGADVARALPSSSRWTVEQHIYHVALSASLALENVSALLAGESARIVAEGGPNETARALFRDGGYPRGRSQAPRTVWPPEMPDASLLDEEIERNRKTLAALTGRVDKVALAKGRIRHRQLGELAAEEWLHFARLHSTHHLQIVRELDAALRS
jgi:hypothetical protein